MRKVELTILDRVPFSTDADKVLARLGLESGMRGEIVPLVSAALERACPRACFAVVAVGEREGDSVRIAGQAFKSHILTTNLARSGSVGLFVATCGRELEAWAESYPDMLLRWCAEELCQLALHAAVSAVEEHLDSLIDGPRHATMNPGSLPDWPLEQQAVLFNALGTVEQAVGVSLTPSFLMRPRKSVSGLRFGTESAFSNCRLCPRLDCPGRRAPYDEMEYDRRYGRVDPGAPACTLTGDQTAC